MARVPLAFSDCDLGRLLYWASEAIRLSYGFLAGCGMFSQRMYQGEASGGCRRSGWEVTVLMQEVAH